MATTDVAVIGAGIVGLSTAYALQRVGVSVTVYEAGVYAAASPDRSRYGVGIAEEVQVNSDGTSVDADALQALADRAVAYVRRALPGLDPTPVGHVHCWVTTLPWGDDGVAVWEQGNIAFLAGHNLFKQAPALGEALARVATGGETPADLRPDARLGHS